VLEPERDLTGDRCRDGTDEVAACKIVEVCRNCPACAGLEHLDHRAAVEDLALDCAALEGVPARGLQPIEARRKQGIEPDGEVDVVELRRLDAE
jgi:hypothetical protein